MNLKGKNAVWGVAVLGGVILFAGLFAHSARRSRPSDAPARRSAGGQKVAATIPLEQPQSAPPLPAVRPQPTKKLWPPNEEVLTSPSGASSGAKANHPKGFAGPSGEATEVRLPPEPAPPSPKEVRQISLWKADAPETATRAREILLDPERSSTIKLLAIEKLRALPPEQAVPLLVEFLESPTSSGTAYTKPSAVKVLRDLGDPVAENALWKLGATCRDEHVRMAIASIPRTQKAK